MLPQVHWQSVFFRTKVALVSYPFMDGVNVNLAIFLFVELFVTKVTAKSGTSDALTLILQLDLLLEIKGFLENLVTNVEFITFECVTFVFTDVLFL